MLLAILSDCDKDIRRSAVNKILAIRGITSNNDIASEEFENESQNLRFDPELSYHLNLLQSEDSKIYVRVKT